jgi:hypothetical protein
MVGRVGGEDLLGRPAAVQAQQRADRVGFAVGTGAAQQGEPDREGPAPGERGVDLQHPGHGRGEQGEPGQRRQRDGDAQPPRGRDDVPESERGRGDEDVRLAGEYGEQVVVPDELVGTAATAKSGRSSPRTATGLPATIGTRPSWITRTGCPPSSSVAIVNA